MSAHALACALLSDVVDSFEKLEVLLRLHRVGPAAAEALARELGLGDDRIAEALVELAKDGVVGRDGDRHQVVEAGPWRAHVDALAALYQEDRMQVVTLMSNAALERMRARASRAFADAFIIGSRKKKGDTDG